MQLWYLRRAVPWTALLGCLAVAVALSLLVHRWPEVGFIAVPLLVGSCAGAAGFVYDEPAVAVASVTPRAGWWRGSGRLLAATLPLVVALVLLSTMPSELRLETGGWWLIGTGGILLAVTAAIWSVRRQVGRPGSAIAGSAVLLGAAPVVLAAVLGWESIYPFGSFSGIVTAFWTAAALCGLAGCVGGLAALGRPRVLALGRTVVGSNGRIDASPPV